MAKALQELGILDQVEAFSGTSIGSVNACFLATTPVDRIHELWLNANSENMKANESFFKRLRQKKMKIFSEGIYKINDLEDTLRSHINIEKLKQKPVFITLSAAGLEDSGVTGLLKASFAHYIRKNRKVVYSPLHKQEKEKIFKQILASCSIPIVFPSVKIEGKQFYDGAVYDNVPVKPLIKYGCDTIIVVHLHRFHLFDPKKYPDTKFHEIIHKRGLGGILNFDPDQAQKRFQMGYDDTIAYFKDKNLY